MLLIKNGLAYLGHGRYEPLDILTEGRRIRAIAPEIEQEGARVIDAAHMRVYPGFVLPMCSTGAQMIDRDSNESADLINPQVYIRHSFDLRELKMQRFGRCGITSYGLSPSQNAIIAGTMALVCTNGQKAADVFLMDRVAMKGNYIPWVKQMADARKKPPATRMGMFYLLDEALTAAREYMDNGRKDRHAKNEALAPVLRREIPFFINAYSLQEITSVLALAEKHRFRLALCGAFAADKCLDKIMEAGHEVVLGDTTAFCYGDYYQTDLAKLVEAYRRGLKLSLYSTGDIEYWQAYEQLFWLAALVCRAGASPDEVIDMMTLHPARALGAENLVGSLEVGKRADMVIAAGNPLARYDCPVEYTITGGEVFYRKGDY